MLITAYYFRAHMYTLVPRHVREDMEWMASVGTQSVAIGVLEQDLFAAVENMEVVKREAERAGMKLLAVPSRWGGLVAGCPKVPSIYTASNPETWILNSAGKPVLGIAGPMSSVHHSGTWDFFRTKLDQMLGLIPFDGVIWDEFKSLHAQDFSEAAQRVRGDASPAPLAETVAFFGKLNRHLKETHPAVSTHGFVYAHMGEEEARVCAAMEALDYFGCDGRPWTVADGGGDDERAKKPSSKTLVDMGPRFIAACKAAGNKSLFLIENHAMAERDYPLMDRRLPEVLALKPDHLLYYYYPRSLDNPDANMEVIAKHLKAAARR